MLRIESCDESSRLTSWHLVRDKRGQSATLPFISCPSECKRRDFRPCAKTYAVASCVRRNAHSFCVPLEPPIFSTQGCHSARIIARMLIFANRASNSKQRLICGPIPVGPISTQVSKISRSLSTPGDNGMSLPRS